MRPSLSQAPGWWIARAGIIVALLAAALLVNAVPILYPLRGLMRPRLLGLTYMSGVILFVLVIVVAKWGLRPKTPDVARDLGLGIGAGIALGMLWVLEIAANNFVRPEVRSRDTFDNIVWATISLATVAIAALRAIRARSWIHGVCTGVWAGFISGLSACLVALLIATVWNDWLTSDPLMIAEYLARGTASGAPDIATYAAYETLAGAMLHLVGLGIIGGGLLGAVGGGIASACRRLFARSAVPVTIRR